MYKTYEEAIQHCPREAYEDLDLVRVVVEKNILYQQKLKKESTFDLNAFRTLIALGLSKRGKSLNVVDYGGGGGYHYFIASKAFGNELSLNWCIVETPAMVDEAQRITSDNLKFFDNVNDAVKHLGSVDLVFTSGTLHCCPQPLETLQKLIDIKSTYLFITRTCFAESPEQFASIQKSYLSTNGPGPLPHWLKDKVVYYPNVFVPRKQVEEILLRHYEIQFKFIEDKAVYTVDKNVLDTFGYYCVRKSL